MSRLWLAALRKTPRGIERVDHAFAKLICSQWKGEVYGISWTPWGVRLFKKTHLESLLAYVSDNWRDNSNSVSDSEYEKICKWLHRDEGFQFLPRKTNVRHKLTRAKAFLQCLSSVGVAIGQNAIQKIPNKSIYVNFGHVGFVAPGIEAFLSSRRDVAKVALVHDTISLSEPQFFPPRNADYFSHVFSRMTDHADIILATTVQGEQELRVALEGRRASHIRSGVVSMQPIFDTLPHFVPDHDLRSNPYFMICGTREPRKNHQLLLNVWHSMHQSGLPQAKLIMAGGYGWGTQHLYDLLDRNDSILRYVARVENLGSAGLFSLMANARALLSPSFAEGFGLPVIEALTLGTPVIASDIEVYRETTCGLATLIDPLNGPQWLSVISSLSQARAEEIDVQRERAASFAKLRPQHTSVLAWLELASQIR